MNQKETRWIIPINLKGIFQTNTPRDVDFDRKIGTISTINDNSSSSLAMKDLSDWHPSGATLQDR